MPPIYGPTDVALGLSAPPKNFAATIGFQSATVINASQLFVTLVTSQGSIPISPYTVSQIPIVPGPLSMSVFAVGTSSTEYPNPYVDVEFSTVPVAVSITALPASNVGISSLTASSFVNINNTSYTNIIPASSNPIRRLIITPLNLSTTSATAANCTILVQNGTIVFGGLPASNIPASTTGTAITGTPYTFDFADGIPNNGINALATSTSSGNIALLAYAIE